VYKITNVNFIKKMDNFVWNVVFQMDNEPLEYTTDFLYLVKEQKWIINSLITHELTSIMQGNKCIYCGESKIACFVASKDYRKIKLDIIESEQFLNEVTSELQLPIGEISSDFQVINDKDKWQQLAEDNRFHSNILRIQRKQ
jgi:hypothetical protein